MVKKIVIAATGLLILAGCSSHHSTEEMLAQQDMRINELQSQVDQLEANQTVIGREMNVMASDQNAMDDKMDMMSNELQNKHYSK